jgi:uncharacterized protein
MANPNAGRFTWHELISTDAVTATKFYTGLFGYVVDEMPAGQMGTYRIFKLGDIAIGGVLQAPTGVPSHWLVYVGVQDTDATAKKISSLGGRLTVSPTTVPDMLRFACATDANGGAPFGIITGLGAGANAPPYDGPTRLGTFCWDELHTRDLEGAKKFYGALFGWSGKSGEGEMPYWHWTRDGKEIGGMTQHMGGPGVPPHWLGYLAVSDVDATTKKAETLGGKVLLPTMDIPKVGTFSVVQDPTGAVFSPFRSARV